MNPLIAALRQEVQLLEKGNLSWRMFSGKCEYIRPVQEYVDQSQLPNLEDFQSDPLNAGIPEDFNRHDHAITVVENKASQFFRGLMNSSLFLEQVKESLQHYRANPLDANRLLEEETESDIAHYVAEYLINNTTALPSHYITHKYWEQSRTMFDHVADGFEDYRQRQTFRELRQASESLKDISGRLLQRLTNHRRLLCTQFDIPAAPFDPRDSNLPNA